MKSKLAKKLGSILLVVALLFPSLSNSLMAAETPTIRVSDSTIEADVSKTTVGVNIENNSGFAAYGLEVVYDANLLTLTGASEGQLLKDSGLTGDFDYSVADGKVTWTFYKDETTMVQGNGNILNLDFNIKDNRFATTDISVKLIDDEPLNFIDAAFNPVSVSFATGKLNVVDSKVVTSWYDPAGTAFVINTPEELAGFAAIVNGTARGIEKDDFSGKTVSLSKDIKLEEEGLYTVTEGVFGSTSYPMYSKQYTVNSGTKLWTPIGTATATSNSAFTNVNYFAGTFDGNGYTVSGLYTDNNLTVQGLFGAVTGTVKNVNVTGLATGKYVVAGIVAYLNGGTVEGCTNQAIAYADGGQKIGSGENGVRRTGAVGGIVGSASGTAEAPFSITLNKNLGSIECPNSNSGGRSGGILGIIDKATDVGSITKSSNAGSVNSYQYAGGIVGLNFSKSVSIDSCSNSGTISANSTGKQYGAGIAAQAAGPITNCYNIGDIVGRTHNGNQVSMLAGITSLLNGGGAQTTTVKNCYNAGRIYSHVAISTSHPLGPTECNVNSYYLDANSDNVTGASRTPDVMKSISFLHLINGEDKAYVRDVDNINNGFPVLAWQSRELSSDASLVSISGQAISAEGDGTIIASPKTGAITLASQVATIEAADIVVAANADVKLYKDSLFTEEGSVDLIIGGDNYAYVEVIAESGDSIYYTISVTRSVPELNVSEAAVDFGNAIINKTSQGKDVTISGVGLLDDISYNLAAGENSAFSVSEKSWTSANGGTLTLSFVPTEEKAYSDILTITSDYAETKEVALTGVGILPTLNVSSESISFGDIIIGMSAPEQETMIDGANLVGDISYSISGADANAFSITEKSWSASAGGNLGIIFTPTDERNYTAVVTITSSNAETKEVTLTGSGIRAGLSVSPESISFGKVIANTPSVRQEVTISGANLAGNISYGISGADASAFSITEKSWSAGAGGQLEITFTPTEKRDYNAIITVTSEHAETKNVTLSGSGVVSELSVSSTRLPFGELTVRTLSAEQEATISGSNLAGDISYSISGTDASAFSITEKSWSANTGGKLGITFAPTEVRGYNAVLTITSNGAETKTINLTGNGKAVVWDVTFKGIDGNLIATVKVEEGKTVTAPVAPEIPGYAFIGWSHEVSNVTSNMEVTAIYIELPELLFPSGNKHTKGSSEGLVAKVEKDMSLFSHVEIDGVRVPEEAYAVTDGSTVVTINPAYLDQLGVGSHQLIIHFTDGSWAVSAFETIAAGSGDGQGQTPSGNTGNSKAPSAASTKIPKTHNGSFEIITLGSIMMAAGLLWIGSKKYFNKDK